MKPLQQSIPNNFRQRGVALVVVLILLLVMTLLGLASVRGTLLEERMSANQFDRSLAFQAAEAALREAERVIAGKPTIPASGCSDGVCAEPDPKEAPRWEDTSFAASNWKTVTISDSLAVAPQYIIEDMGMAPEPGACPAAGDVTVQAEGGCSAFSRRYRITARSVAKDRAQVILQANFAAQ